MKGTVLATPRGGNNWDVHYFNGNMQWQATTHCHTKEEAIKKARRGRRIMRKEGSL